MDLNLIKKLVKIVDTSEITDLEVEENGLRIKVAKKIRGTQTFTQPQIISQPAPAFESTTKTPEEPTSKTEVQENLHEVRSPIVGTFYRAPAPDADSYVNVGDEVTQGTVLCIVEAMKLMNEIESDINGKIIKILVENGKPVEYNQPLFLIQVS
ncbi:MAG: acetyl-CoA carboxylase, biotin carboxyl carrier protein [Ignavibacteria bacterium GWA2_35_9]|nr:MAG: acetyl-CoA carboxylase, biotin carboxyl carrier protein [Ignavibacteria bacterium GWA2_35_9]OGU48472.1 MAG: acetyl-CoA carboxylase, biotin carboxyl carrier protein [Ignavibacteria bacterium GWB2_36_8]OGU49447.1 MAG: acetyl-CoA carboxylase, biotin carboxyl carrier protein [Ignavibacteria bacterium GWC2_36_12]OGU97280.1 MAG: acetyl-CoA carboxylase, biotin carboxyl carrier protein [Ignavibacteria bacterium RIFOXYB2_FULL_36_7]OGV23598.1 MAG: acetyl-CoA carboxylase, biotin carboxyl carrier p